MTSDERFRQAAEQTVTVVESEEWLDKPSYQLARHRPGVQTAPRARGVGKQPRRGPPSRPSATMHADPLLVEDHGRVRDLTDPATPRLDEEKA